MKQTFRIGRVDLPYYAFSPDPFHLNNSERVVEIPIGAYWLGLYQGKFVLEVGDTMRQYVGGKHVIVDKYEVIPGNLNVDIVDYHPQEFFDLVLSVSTLEHVGIEGAERTGDDDKDGFKPLRAIDHMKRLLNPGGRLVITIPMGWNHLLQERIMDGELESRLSEHHWLKRDADNLWEETTAEDAKAIKFGAPYPPFANAMYVGYYTRPRVQ